jgi:hypothetical protein
MNLKSILITLMSFCFILNAQSVDKKKRATRVSKGKSKTAVVKTVDKKDKSLTSSRVAKGQTKTKKTAKNARSTKVKSAGKLSASKRVSTKSSASVGKEKPLPVKEKAKKNLLTDAKDDK